MMFGQLISMGLSFLLLWSEVWAPTFQGTPEQRFVSAMEHYRVKMGLEDTLIYASGGKHPKGWCSSVEFSREFDGVMVLWYEQTRSCRRVRPEFWALHEACHLRYQHHRIAAFGVGPGEPATEDAREAETRSCMVLYSAKERR